jgi:hypothetical protein
MEVSKMMAEDRAARVVWRLLAPSVGFEAFERHLLRQKRPEWNQAVALVADEIREAVEEARTPPYEAIHLKGD